MIIDEKAKKWLAEHSHDLEPEEIAFEEEKVDAAFRAWPTPEEVDYLGKYVEIDSPDSFNRIVGDPNNWEEILNRKDLFENWILPHAVLFFAKNWFDRVKWNSHIQRGVPFPLFSNDEKEACRNTGRSLEDTPSGRAKIAHIMEKASHALKVYLRGDFWYEKGIMKPAGPYVIEAVKNSFIKEAGADQGFKSRNTPACPYCLSHQQKTIVVKQTQNRYSCPRCTDLAANLELQIISLKEKNGDGVRIIEEQYRNVSFFKDFHGVTCVCPSDNCSGKFVPITCIDQNAMVCRYREMNAIRVATDRLMGTKGTHAFKEPTGLLRKLPLTCPFCNTKFTPAVAMRFKSGFKNKSGLFTGIPTICIWEQPEEITLDVKKIETDTSLKNRLAASIVDLDNQIFLKQRIRIISEELIIHMSSINKKSVSGLITWYFYAATIKWAEKHYIDAFRYFFGGRARKRDMTSKEMKKYPGQTKKRMTDVLRGTEIAIHQSLFQTWQDLLEQNISEFTALDQNITSLKDFGWFCRPPKFSGGPRSIFRAQIDSKRRVINESKIVARGTPQPAPRLAKILSIYKIENSYIDYDTNYVNDIRFCEWQAIYLDADSQLVPGDKVRVEALVMSGHPTHAPIQRILRLRTKTLATIINRLLEEEKTNSRDIRFWDSRKEAVVKAEKSFDISKILGE